MNILRYVGLQRSLVCRTYVSPARQPPSANIPFSIVSNVYYAKTLVPNILEHLLSIMRKKQKSTINNSTNLTNETLKMRAEIGD